MIRFRASIKKFSNQGEKTGWTFIEVTADIARELKPGSKKSFRVKGRLDDYQFESIALLPMGEGSFIMPLNAAVRKGTGKRKGAMVNIEIELDDKPLALNADLVQCLTDEPEALSFFNTLTPGHKRYFNNWIESAKTESTKAIRIAQTITATARKQDFGMMMREKKNRKDLFSPE